jgi:hypothetical protein
VGIMRIDQADVALVPDPVRATDDVVDDIRIFGVEAPQRLNARSVGRHELSEVATFDLQHGSRVVTRLLGFGLRCPRRG